MRRFPSSTCALLLVHLLVQGNASAAPPPLGGHCPTAGAILFQRSTDTIAVAGDLVLGTAYTAEARVMLCCNLPVTNGSLFLEQYDQLEDKALIVSQAAIGGTCQTPSVPSSFTLPPGSMPQGFWHHVAFVYDGTQQRIYLNGFLQGSRAVTGDIDDTPLGSMAIGAFVEPVGGEFRGSFVGFVDTLRISNVARYTTSTFAPPQGDLPADGSTLLLYHFNEPLGSTTVADLSGNGFDGSLGVGFAGATSPVIAAKPVCPLAGAILFDELTDTIAIAGDTVLGTTFTAEARLMFCPNLPSTSGVVFSEQYDSQEDKALIVRPGTLGGTAWNPADPTEFLVSAPTSNLVWHHVAFVHENGVQRVYLDGVLMGSRTAPASISNFPGTNMAIGAWSEPLGGTLRGGFTGHIDTLRISSVARYTGASFVPPSGNLPNEPGTLILYHFDEPSGSTSVTDLSGNGFNGLLGVGFPGATPPRLAAWPEPVSNPPGTPVCFGDGSGGACPCGNTGNIGAGCASIFTGDPSGIQCPSTPTAVGTTLTASGSNSLSMQFDPCRRLVLTAVNTTTQLGLFYSAVNTIAGGIGAPFGDGRRCCGGLVIRLQVIDLPSQGAGVSCPATGSTTVDLTNMTAGTVTPGLKLCYQYWYRNPGPASPCGTNFNLSNAITVIWTP